MFGRGAAAPTNLAPVIRAIALVFAFAAALFAGNESVAQDLAPIPALASRVTDTAGVLGTSAKQELDAKLVAFEQATGGQLAVLIVKTAEPETIDQYGIRVGDAWKIGKKGKDTGAILIIAMKEKKYRAGTDYLLITIRRSAITMVKHWQQQLTASVSALPASSYERIYVATAHTCFACKQIA